MMRMKTKAQQKLTVEVEEALSSDDLRSAATALDDLVEDVIPNTLANLERAILSDVAGWLRAVAKRVEPRDVADWDAVRATREEREARATNQSIASERAVGEATIRAASIAKAIDRSKRRIVR